MAPPLLYGYSDDRSPEAFRTHIEAATQMESVLGIGGKPNCLVIDEIDGAPTVGLLGAWPVGGWVDGQSGLWLIAPAACPLRLPSTYSSASLTARARKRPSWGAGPCWRVRGGGHGQREVS